MSPEPAMGGNTRHHWPNAQIVEDDDEDDYESSPTRPLPSYCTRAYAEYDAGFPDG